MQHNDAEYDDSITPAPAETGALVLLAEPDADLRTAFTDALRHAGYAVRSIAEPSRVAAEAGLVTPALIIARLNDPTADGFTLCRALRGAPETRDTPLLILMRLDDMYTREQIVRAGATAILIEPLRRTLLLRQVRRLLARGARTAAHSRSTSWSAGAFTVSRAAS
jgi:DNA-binding response OmpR family regulator